MQGWWSIWGMSLNFLFSSLQPFLCQTFYTLIEYGKTTMFLWMFIEGIILHHMTTVAYSRGPDNQLTFYLCGWRKKNYEYLILSMTSTIRGGTPPGSSLKYLVVHPSCAVAHFFGLHRPVWQRLYSGTNTRATAISYLYSPILSSPHSSPCRFWEIRKFAYFCIFSDAHSLDHRLAGHKNVRARGRQQILRPRIYFSFVILDTWRPQDCGSHGKLTILNMIYIFLLSS